MMKKNDKIYVAGHTGMVGSAIVRSLKKQGFTNIITRRHCELALDKEAVTYDFFAKEKPTYVFIAAAKVGGIIANQTYGADFIFNNLKIQNNVIDAAYKNGTKKLMLLGSSCIYPKFAEQPIKESALLTGELEPTNLPYAVAKIAGKVMCDAYRQQYNFDAFTIMPCNVYGIGDNVHPENSHMVAGLMRRFYEAKKNQQANAVVWGTGKAQRELINADDLGDASIFLMQNYWQGGIINVGSSNEYTILEIAELMKRVVGFSGGITLDTSKPDGTPRKIMDNSKIKKLGWSAKINLQEGLEKMYQWFLENKAA